VKAQFSYVEEENVELRRQKSELEQAFEQANGDIDVLKKDNTAIRKENTDLSRDGENRVLQAGSEDETMSRLKMYKARSRRLRARVEARDEEMTMQEDVPSRSKGVSRKERRRSNGLQKRIKDLSARLKNVQAPIVSFNSKTDMEW